MEISQTVSLLTNPTLSSPAAQQEDLDFLASILEESLVVIGQGKIFQVKCAVKDHLMVLIEHPNTVTVDTEHLFTVVAKRLQSEYAYQTQEVQVFIRRTGEKFPYGQKTLYTALNASIASDSNLFADVILPDTHQESQNSESRMFNSSASLLTITANVIEEDKFNLFEMAPQPPQAKKSQPSFKSLIIGACVLAVATIFGASGYFLMSPCILSTCKELQTAKELQNSFPQLANNVKTEEDLSKLGQQLDATIASLQRIPGWSPNHQNALGVATTLSSESQQIKLLAQALQSGATALQTSQSLTNDINELKSRSELWRQAITPLEAIPTDSKFYNLAQSRLSLYRGALQSVNVQMLAQSRWQKKVNDAVAAAKVANQRETEAKSLPDLQRASDTWQVAVNALIAVPQTSPAYTEARKLLDDYQPRLIAIRDRVSKQEQAATSFAQAITTAKQAEQYEQQNQWQPATIRWQQAINTIKQIPSDNPLYNQAQPLLQAYVVAFEQAQAKSQTMSVSGATASTTSTRADLEKTCKGTVRICNFTVDERFITVRITPEYEKTLESNVTGAELQNVQNVKDVQKHLETLQKALEVIGDNANTAVLVFDAQGQQIFTHIPRQ
jgi:tetratricopeptide (TPR) repeat protein